MEGRPLCDGFDGCEGPDGSGFDRDSLWARQPHADATVRTLAQQRARADAENLLLNRAIRRSLAEARRREACRRTLEECKTMQKQRMEEKQKK